MAAFNTAADGDLLHTPAPTNKQAHVMSAPGYLKETPIWTDWILFEVGWVSGIAWFIGVFVPLCRRPRFPAPRNKAGWIANLIGSILLIALIIAAIVVSSKNNNDDDQVYYTYG